jgi:hypothetical protein
VRGRPGRGITPGLELGKRWVLLQPSTTGERVSACTAAALTFKTCVRAESVTGKPNTGCDILTFFPYGNRFPGNKIGPGRK